MVISYIVVRRCIIPHSVEPPARLRILHLDVGADNLQDGLLPSQRENQGILDKHDSRVAISNCQLMLSTRREVLGKDQHTVSYDDAR